MNVQLMGQECTVEFLRHELVMTTALRIRVRDTGEPITTATLCMPGYELDPDTEVMVKTYTEHHWILDALILAGVVEPAHTFLDIRNGERVIRSDAEESGHVAVCRLTNAAMEARAAQEAA